MFPISNELKVRNNLLDSYYPLRNKGNEFDWNKITGLVLCMLIGKHIKSYEFESFRNEAKEVISTKLDDPSFWATIDQMYFEDGEIFSISALFLLFNAQGSQLTKKEFGHGNWRIGTLFYSFLREVKLEFDAKDNLNFVENELLTVLKKHIVPFQDLPFDYEMPYLPYLVDLFKQDVKFLISHPNYLLKELSNTLKLYLFIYSTQLALNLRSWNDVEPKSKPLYFILDTEKASNERSKVHNEGYKRYSQMTKNIFPILSALEVLQTKDSGKRPLWKIFKDINDYEPKNVVLSNLNDYIADFCKDRGIDNQEKANSIDEAFKTLINISIEQFDEAKKSERAGVNKKYIKELETKICSDFIQIRGRSGRILIINQDYLVLLTNLAIGERDKLRLHDLIKEFENRGFYFDIQTKQSLVKFYERIGNVERMSDSGDAVYVLKTI